MAVSLIIAALVIAVGVVIGGGILLLATSLDSGKESNTLSGSLEAPECGGGYALVNANVELRNESDTLIGSAITSSDANSGEGCRVDFLIEDVPRADFYQIRIGTHGGPSYTYEELEAQDWNLSMSLGGG